MRTVTDHITPANEALNIAVLDEPGFGGACHDYQISWNGNDGEPAAKVSDNCRVSFQNGPIKEFGVNGVTHEALLAIVIDRLRSFQSGPFACAENYNALNHCEAALEALKSRTLARMQRGVEGTNQQ